MKIALRNLGPRLAIICDLLGFLALSLTPDVERVLFLAPLGIGLLRYAKSVFLRDRLLLLFFTFLVLFGYATAAGAPTGTFMARAIIPAHAFLWLAKDEVVYRFWRIGIALLEIVLAAILAPEAHMFILLFLFVMSGSMALSIGFIERNFRVHEPHSLERPLPGSFVLAILSLSFLIFLSSLLIFPLLPRSQWHGSGTDAYIGYNDVVNFQQGILRWKERDSKPVLWIYRQSETPWEKLVPFFLLRGQALERFDGNEWSARPGKEIPRPHVPVSRKPDLEILRQPFPSDILPVPYGTIRARSLSDFLVIPHGPGEWAGHGKFGQSLRYLVEAEDSNSKNLGENSEASNLLFDPKLFPRISALAKDLQKAATGEGEKLSRVKSYFAKEDFSYELLPVDAYVKGNVHPVEKFLFEARKGHCELFATAGALLLRASGIPARLVVGFRVRAPSRGNAITVKSSEAHSWVEYWSASKGWVPFDPTPPAKESLWMGEGFRDAYEVLQAYWHRDILEYEVDRDRLLGLAFKTLALIFVSFFAALAFKFIKKRKRSPNTRERLFRIREKFEESLLYRNGLLPNAVYEKSPEAGEWRECYKRLRFGRIPPTEGDLREMKGRARELLRILA